MAKFKDWKDGEKFNAIQYTTERNILVDKVIQIDSQAQDKADLIILSETPPENPDAIWLDPGNYQGVSEISKNVVYSVNIFGHREYFQKTPQFTEQLAFDAVAQGFQPLVKVRNTAESTTFNAEAEGFVVPIIDKTLSEVATFNSDAEGYVMQIEKKALDETALVQALADGSVVPIIRVDNYEEIDFYAEATGKVVPIISVENAEIAYYSAEADGRIVKITNESSLAELQVTAEASGFTVPLQTEQVQNAVTINANVDGNEIYEVYAQVTGLHPYAVVTIGFAFNPRIDEDLAALEGQVLIGDTESQVVTVFLESGSSVTYNGTLYIPNAIVLKNKNTSQVIETRTTLYSINLFNNVTDDVVFEIQYITS